MVLRAFVQPFYHLGHVVNFFRSQRQVTELTPAFFRRTSANYHAWLDEQAHTLKHATDGVRLDLALGRPILVVDSTDVDAGGKPLLTTRARFAAEQVEFVVENT